MNKKPDFIALIHYTVGINKSAAITQIDERWLGSSRHCDVIYNELVDEDAITVLECIGIDMKLEGHFAVNVQGIAVEDEYPEYTILGAPLRVSNV